jgi:hypothetical protein
MKKSELRQLIREEIENLTNTNVVDTITMDVPLFIRLLEYAREDAQTDMDLHDLAEKAIAGTKQQGILSMDDYDMLIGDSTQDLSEEVDQSAGTGIKSDDSNFIISDGLIV